MVERATTIMGEPGPQGEPGQPAEQQKGSSLLGTLLRLGIGAFAIKFLWPALLPLLKGSLGALGKLVFSKLGAGIGAAVGGTILSLPLLRRFRDPFQKKSEELGSGIGEFVAEKVNTIGEDGSVDTGSGGQVVSESNVDINDKNVDDLEDTLEDKDLIPTYEKNRRRNKNLIKKETSESTYKSGENPEKDNLIKLLIKEEEKKEKELEEASDEDFNTVNSELETISEAIDNLKFNEKENEFGGYDYLQNFLKEQNIKVEGNKEPFAADKVGEVDLQSKEYLEAKRINESLKIEPVDSDMTQAIAKTNERIDNLIGGENKEQNNGNLVSANKPNVTEATLKLAAAPLPFVKVIKNNQLSTSPKSYNGLPPEIAAMIS